MRNMLDSHQYDKLKAICDYALGHKSNPLMNAENARFILKDWANDRTKPKEFRLLCDTLAKTGKFEQVVTKQKKYMIIEGTVILGTGTAKELADTFAIKVQQIRYYATSGGLFQKKWRIKEINKC